MEWKQKSGDLGDISAPPPSAAPPETDGAAKAALGGQQAMITFPLRRSAAETLGITRTH